MVVSSVPSPTFTPTVVPSTIKTGKTVEKNNDSKTYVVCGQKIDVVKWDDFDLEISPKIDEGNTSLPYRALYFGTMMEQRECYDEWNWRAHRFGMDSKRKRFMGGGEPAIGGMRKRIQSDELQLFLAAVSQLPGDPKKHHRQLTKDDLPKIVSQYKTKALILVAMDITEGIFEYPDNSNGEPIALGPLQGLQDADVREKDGKLENVTKINNGKVTMTIINPFPQDRDCDFLMNKTIFGVCQDYTYVFENILNWMRFDLKAPSLQNIYTVQKWAPGHTWPMIIEFKNNEEIIATEVDPTLDAMGEKHLQNVGTGKDWTDSAIDANLQFNSLLGVRALLQKFPSQKGESIFRKLCQETAQKNKEVILDHYPSYSYFVYYMPFKQPELAKKPIAVDKITDERLGEIICQELKDIPVIETEEGFKFMTSDPVNQVK